MLEPSVHVLKAALGFIREETVATSFLQQHVWYLSICLLSARYSKIQIFKYTEDIYEHVDSLL